VHKIMRERGVSFKAALNSAIREGLRNKSSKNAQEYHQRTFPMGFHPDLPLDKALALAAAMEDAEISRELSLGK